MVDVNLTGTYNVTRAALPALLASERKPAIVNLGSTAAARRASGGSHYAASKGGVISFTKALARELGPRGVRANCVAPGIIETDMTLGKFGEIGKQNSNKAFRCNASARPPRSPRPFSSWHRTCPRIPPASWSTSMAASTFTRRAQQ